MRARAWPSRWLAVSRGTVPVYLGILIFFSFCHGLICSVNHWAFNFTRIVREITMVHSVTTRYSDGYNYMMQIYECNTSCDLCHQLTHTCHTRTSPQSLTNTSCLLMVMLANGCLYHPALTHLKPPRCNGNTEIALGRYENPAPQKQHEKSLPDQLQRGVVSGCLAATLYRRSGRLRCVA